MNTRATVSGRLGAACLVLSLAACSGSRTAAPTTPGNRGGTVEEVVVAEAPLTCDRGDDPYGPVRVSPEEWQGRKGAGVTRFSQAASTKGEPVEVCGIRNEMTWLLAATCDDGSNPFGGFEEAHAARVGNVGAGGRCSSIIDLYEVPCPEATYEIYMDAYVCAEGGQP